MCIMRPMGVESGKTLSTSRCAPNTSGTPRLQPDMPPVEEEHDQDLV
jgi:hypothetical protein